MNLLFLQESDGMFSFESLVFILKLINFCLNLFDFGLHSFLVKRRYLSLKVFQLCLQTLLNCLKFPLLSRARSMGFRFPTFEYLNA